MEAYWELNAVQRNLDLTDVQNTLDLNGMQLFFLACALFFLFVRIHNSNPPLDVMQIQYQHAAEVVVHVTRTIHSNRLHRSLSYVTSKGGEKQSEGRQSGDIHYKVKFTIV